MLDLGCNGVMIIFNQPRAYLNMTSMDVMEGMTDLCDRFITSIHIKGDVENNCWI